ncbi:rnf213a, partial [Symbiodinium sp. KB8]
KGLTDKLDLENLAKAYYQYYEEQPVQDYHGLRDFYFFVKALAKKWPKDHKTRQFTIFRAAFRNFCGLPEEVLPHSEYAKNTPCLFVQAQWRCLGLEQWMSKKTVNVLDLVEENLSDKLCARHLLLVCSGGTETAIGLVQTAASRAGRQIQIMVGSTFPEDRSDHYAFSLLKRITLSMEKGDVLVMRGLDVVHGSLYDMLNMSYTTMGGKQLCRIALGDADMLTEVHESFRCVVLQEKTQLDKLDAAFLNRFEKHCVGIEAGMSEEVPLKTVQMLRHQVNLAAMPRVEEVFVGWGPETAASLVAQVSAEAGSDCDNPLQLLRHCWLRLASVATTDGMLRATELSELAGRYPKWAQEWREHVFTQPQSLPEWIKANGWQHRVEPETPPTGRFAVMITMSPLHINLTELLKEQVPGMACVAVDALTSELDLETGLLLQCRANSPHVELVRHRVYSQLPGDRRALLLLHGDRKVLAPSDSRSTSRQLGLSVRLNFQSGWAQVFLEQLVAKDDAVDIPKCVNLSLESLLDDAGPLHFERVLKSVLTECFWYIKYPPTKEAAEHVKEVSELVLGDPGLLAEVLGEGFQHYPKPKSQIGGTPENDLPGGHAHAVVPAREAVVAQGHHEHAAPTGPGVEIREASTRSVTNRGHASFADCIEAYIRHQIRRPAAMWIQQLENLCALKTLKFYQGECDLRNAWFEICDQVVSLQGVAPPQKSECYPYRQHLQSLHVPFAAYFAEKLDGFRAIFFEHQLHKMDPGNPALRDFRLAMEAAIPDQWMELLRQHRQAYVKDLAVLKLTAVPLPQTEQLRILQPIFQEQSAFEDWGVPEIHQFLWCHQGSLQAVLRQLAAVPSQLRDLEGFMASMIGQERHLVTSDMTTLMHLVTDHACSALHPCAAALNTTNTGWLPNARRVLAAARNALDCSSQQSATQPVSVSALSIMVEVSQRLETDVTEFWRSVLLETPIKRPIALQQLVERLLQGAQAHMDQSSLQHLQLSTYQQLIPHGASDAIVKSLTSGVPVVASALQLRSLVRGACKENSRCLLEALRSASPASRSTPSTALQTLQDLACSAGPGGPLNAVLCIEIEEFGLPWLHLDAANSGGEVVGLPTAVLLAAEILRSFERSKFGLQHVVAAAVLRAAATQAASLLSSESPVAWDGLDHALVHARAGNVATTVELCSPVPWLKESLPVPGDMPQLAGHLPAFLGGFCPEAVESAQVIERALQLRQTSDLAAIAEKADAGIWRFGFFAASSNLLCSDPGPDRELREQGRRWLASQPELRSLPALMRCHLEGLPAPLRQGLQARDLAEQLPLLTSLHMAAAISAAPISGLSHPLKLAADGVAGMFLPAMPDDEEQVILQALNEGYANARFHGHTRYECQCGYRFIVADCGQAVQESTCPQCRRRIGGFEYARHGNRRVDASPVVTPATLQSKQGYFPHPASRERSLSVRSISPLSFRALHFLLHSSFFTKLWDTSAWAVQNVAGILEHLRADWDVLTQILGACPAGFLMDVSGKLMFTSRSTVQTVMTQKERLQWERHFAEVIIEPCVDNVQRAEFDAQLSWDRVAGHAEETLPLLLLDRLPPLSARATTDEQGGSAEASQAHRLAPRGCKCLELGAGNFTFALSLARARGPEGLTASTLEPIDVVKARYSRLDDRLLAEIADLEALGVRLLAGVDGTILQNTEVGAQKFDVIIFNFPHGGTFDDTASKISCSDHGALIDGLFGGVKSSLTPDGYFCMTLLKSQYTRWHIQQRANNQGFRLVSDETFDRNSFPEYRPVWGDDRDFTRPSQPWQIYSGEEPKIYRFQPKGRRTAAASSANHPSNTPKPVERALAAVLGTVCDEAPLFCCRMLRLAEKPSLPKLEREFQSKAALSERYPLLAAWLQARQDLQLANNLAAVQDWLRFVQNHFGFKVARPEARMTVYEALQKLEDDRGHNIGQIPETQGTLTTAARGRQLFDRFCTAWAKCRDAGCMQRHGCKSLTPVGPMSAKSPLSLSCADETTEEGSYVLALVNDLAVRQNTFVETCLEVASQRDGPSARRVRSVTEYWFHQGRVSLPVVKMQDLDPLHLVHGGHLGLSEQLPLAGSAGALAAWETNGFSPADIERPDLLVSGSTCVFDWELLEQQLAEKVLQKAVHLDTSIDPFPFSGEAFLHGYGFLEEALAQVAQEPSPEEPRQFLLDSGSALNLLCSLQAAIASVRRLSPQPELAVSDFCARWLHETHLHHLTSQLECRGLLVKHLVHLFEVVELYAADEALQQHSLPKPYCAELSTLLPQMKVWDGDAAGVVLDVLRRVVMRFLLHGRTWDAEEEVNAFVEYAMRKIPELDFQSVSGLFDGMKLKHINAAIEHARQLMPKPHSEQ